MLDRTHGTLHSRRTLYQLSYQSYSAGMGSNLRKTSAFVLRHSILSLGMHRYSENVLYVQYQLTEKSQNDQTRD